MNDLEGKVFLERARALVVGQLGHVYVAVENGQHGAPYTCTSGHHTERQAPVAFWQPVRQHLALGDTMGGVLLSMVNVDVARHRNLEELFCTIHPSDIHGKTSPLNGWRR